MAAMVEMCMNELGKLGEKVGAAKKRPLVFWAKVKEGQVMKAEREEEVEEAKEISSRKERPGVKDSSSLSEETVFLLMDRFAPL